MKESGRHMYGYHAKPGTGKKFHRAVRPRENADGIRARYGVDSGFPLIMSEGKLERCLVGRKFDPEMFPRAELGQHQRYLGSDIDPTCQGIDVFAGI